MNHSELKLRAKQMLAGNWGLVIAVFCVSSAITTAAASIQGIGSLLVAGPVGVGVCGIYMALAEGRKPEFVEMFNGFRNFVNCFIAGLLNGILVLLFSLLLVVPGIIKALAYSQAYYILNDHPEMDGWSALKASEQMMNGHKMELFSLIVSFIPWMLLCVFVFPVLFVAPYMSATMTEYYKRLSAQYVID